MLELKNISFSRDNKEILKNINLKIDSNKFIAITGPNGSGKSSLAKIIMGINTPNTGKIIFRKEDITNRNITDRANMGIGFAFQQPVTFKGFKVKDMLEIAANESISIQAACEYLSNVGLCALEYIDREINNKLSGGELKRIELAMLEAKKSKLTIFDEPEAGIDLWSFNNLISIFNKMSKREDSSIIVISHQEKILNIADEIILLVDGKIKDMGSKEKILPQLFKEQKSCTSNC